MKKCLILISIIIFSASQTMALDKQKLEKHMLEALNLDVRADITVGDPTPSLISDLLDVPVTIQGRPYSVYVTPDESYYIWGTIYDLSTHPDRDRAKKLNLKNAHYQGSKNAPVTLVEFFNFQCSHCHYAHEALSKELYKTYKKKEVRWVIKHFPLSGSAWAEKAAVAVECVAEQRESALWEYSDLLFKNSSELSKDNIDDKSAEFAKRLGLNASKFNKCTSGEKALAKVRADKQEGVNAGVSSTPTFFINGRMKRGFRKFEDIKVVIDEKLKK